MSRTNPILTCSWDNSPVDGLFRARSWIERRHAWPWIAFLLFVSVCAHASPTTPVESAPALAIPAPVSVPCIPGTPPSVSELWAILGRDVETRFAGSTPRIFLAELDGSGSKEAVAVVDRVDTGSMESGGEGRVWALRCADGAWTSAAETSFAIDAGWQGTLDGTPGFQNVRAERLLPDRDVVRVEWLDLRGAYDPRFVVRSFELFALRGASLERIFGCPTEHFMGHGPDRGGRSIHRTVQFVDARLPARIRVTMRSAWDPGAGASGPDDGLPEDETRQADYTYDGTRFMARRPVCGEAAHR